jgi:hypothetical protein
MNITLYANKIIIQVSNTTTDTDEKSRVDSVFLQLATTNTLESRPVWTPKNALFFRSK